MTRIATLVAAMSATAVFVSPALAVTVTNQDAAEHTLTVDRGVQEDQQKLAAGASAQIKCPERCEFRVVGMGYGRTAGDGDKLVIAKGGLIQFQSEMAPAKEADAAGKK